MVSRSLSALAINTGFARAVIDGLVDGHTWTSPTVGTAAVHAIHPYGMSLVWGRRVDDAFDELITHLTSRPQPVPEQWLQVDPRWHSLPWGERLERAGANVEHETRVNFTFTPERFTPAAAPDGWRLRPATVTDFNWRGSVVPAGFWRDAPQFLANGGGWVAERDGVVGSMAFSSFRFDECIELGIETHPAARGHGLGRAVASRMIVDILSASLTPVWACRKGNHASYRLAQRLGFTPSTELPYYHLSYVESPRATGGAL
jgi:RimJ/RimL family protein N-acetyltransferase